MMAMPPPVGWADVATKQDLAALRHDMVALRGCIAKVEDRIAMIEFDARIRRELRRQMIQFNASLYAALTLFSVVDRLV